MGIWSGDNSGSGGNGVIECIIYFAQNKRRFAVGSHIFGHAFSASKNGVDTYEYTGKQNTKERDVDYRFQKCKTRVSTKFHLCHKLRAGHY